MIAKLTGKITRANNESVIIDVNGVGYLVFCSAKTLEIVSKNEEVISLLVETMLEKTTFIFLVFLRRPSKIVLRF